MSALEGTEFEGLVPLTTVKPKVNTPSIKGVDSHADLNTDPRGVVYDRNGGLGNSLPPLEFPKQAPTNLQVPKIVPMSTSVPEEPIDLAEFEHMQDAPEVANKSVELVDLGAPKIEATNEESYPLIKSLYRDSKGILTPESTDPRVMEDLLSQYKTPQGIEEAYNNQLKGKDEEDKVSKLLAEGQSTLENLSTLFTQNTTARDLVISKLQEAEPSFKVSEDGKFFTSKFNPDPRPLDSSLWDTIKANKWATGAAVLAGIVASVTLPVTATGAVVGTLGASTISAVGGLIDQQQGADNLGIELSAEDRLSKASAVGAVNLIGDGALLAATKFFKGVGVVKDMVKNGESISPSAIGAKYANGVLDKDIEKAFNGMTVEEKADVLDVIQKASKEFGIDMPMSSVDNKGFISMLQSVSSRNPIIANELKKRLEQAVPKWKSALDTLLNPTNAQYSTRDTAKNTLIKDLHGIKESIVAPIRQSYDELEDLGADIKIPVSLIKQQKDNIAETLSDIIEQTKGAGLGTRIRPELNEVLKKLQKDGNIDTTKLERFTSPEGIHAISSMSDIPEDVLTKALSNIPKGGEEEYLKTLGTSIANSLKPKPTTTAGKIAPVKPDTAEYDAISPYISKLNALGSKLLETLPSKVSAKDLMYIQRFLNKRTGKPELDMLYQDTRKDILKLIEDTTPTEYSAKLKQTNKDYLNYSNNINSDGSSGRAILFNLKQTLSHTLDDNGEKLLPHSGNIDSLFTGKDAINNLTQLRTVLEKHPEGRKTLDELANYYLQGFVTSTEKHLNPKAELEHFNKLFSHGTVGKSEGVDMNVMRTLLTDKEFNDFKYIIRMGEGLNKAFENLSVTPGFMGMDSNLWSKTVRVVTQAIKYLGTDKLLTSQSLESALLRNISNSKDKDLIIEELQKQGVLSKLKDGAIKGSVRGVARILSKSDPSEPKADKSKKYKFINKGVK